MADVAEDGILNAAEWNAIVTRLPGAWRASVSRRLYVLARSHEALTAKVERLERELKAGCPDA